MSHSLLPPSGNPGHCNWFLLKLGILVSFPFFTFPLLSPHCPEMAAWYGIVIKKWYIYFMISFCYVPFHFPSCQCQLPFPAASNTAPWAPYKCKHETFKFSLAQRSSSITRFFILSYYLWQTPPSNLSWQFYIVVLIQFKMTPQRIVRHIHWHTIMMTMKLVMMPTLNNDPSR